MIVFRRISKKKHLSLRQDNCVCVSIVLFLFSLLPFHSLPFVAFGEHLPRQAQGHILKRENLSKMFFLVSRSSESVESMYSGIYLILGLLTEASERKITVGEVTLTIV